MSYFNKPVGATLHTAQASRHSEMNQDADDIARGVNHALNKVFEACSSAGEREEMTAKRKIIAKHYGQVVADALSGKALDRLYQQCPDENAPTANSQNMRSGAPDPAAYFAGNDEKTGYRGAPNPTEYFR